MAKIRFTKPGQVPNKKKFKRNRKIKLVIFRLFLLAVVIYIIDKENLIELVKTLINQ
jgi:hypothetical protein